MSDEQLVGDQATDSGASVVKTSSTENQQSKVVSWDDHKRVLDDMLKHKRALGEREAELKAHIKTLEEKSLQEKQDYKSLWEKEAQARKESDEASKRLKQGFIFNEKYRAVSQALVKAGVIPEVLEDIEAKHLEDIVVESTSEGRFIINGVETFVDSFKQKKPYLFKQATPVTINGGGGDAPPVSGDITIAMVLEAEAAANKDPTKKDKYNKLYSRYLAQKKK